MGSVDRKNFVPQELQDIAYADQPLPIGYGQTISQPSLVDFMTAELHLEPSFRVLEIGTGSGYQAALLAGRVAEVFSVEIIRPLADAARERLARLGFGNVRVRFGNGWYGWPEEAPFDAIVVTAAAPCIPPLLVNQLKPGGRMIIPVGDPGMVQDLMLVVRKADAEPELRELFPVRFVPLTGIP